MVSGKGWDFTSAIDYAQRGLLMQIHKEMCMTTKRKTTKKHGCGCAFHKKKSTGIGQFGNGEDNSTHENLKEERKAQTRLNKKLRMISDHKHKLNIPWHLITDAVTSEGFVMPLLHGLDDNKPGRVHVQVGNKTWLAVQWYPFQNDTFEITAYAN